ncbi:alkaline phosphatase family protein [soil metagenome]
MYTASMSQIVRPNYGQGCFSDLPGATQAFLTGQPLPPAFAALDPRLVQQYDAVILVLADGFGWRFFERFANRDPFLRRFGEQGAVLRWTAQFPSTTTAHVSCINTGLTPGQSGLFEWQFYEPQLDAVIVPLMFSFAGDKARETLKSTGIKPADLYPAQTFYQTLGQQGIASYVYQHRDYAHSSYTNWLGRGAQIVPYLTWPEALLNVRQQVTQASKPAFYYLYFDKIDSISHYYGPDSAQMEAEIETFLFCMERAFMQPMLRQAKNVLLMLTADHGQANVDPATTLYLNRDPRFKRLERYLRTDGNGELLAPGGSARDIFLYIKDADLDEAKQFLGERLEDKANVYKTQDLIDQGYFGPRPVAQKFLDRVGNLLILPNPGETVWWYEKGKFEQNFYGHHGGLTADEMEIPLCLYAFGAG